MIKSVVCHDSRECFAKSNGICQALADTYTRDGECPFCKTREELDDGRKSDNHKPH